MWLYWELLSEWPFIATLTLSFQVYCMINFKDQCITKRVLLVYKMDACSILCCYNTRFNTCSFYFKVESKITRDFAAQCSLFTYTNEVMFCFYITIVYMCIFNHTFVTCFLSLTISIGSELSHIFNNHISMTWRFNKRAAISMSSTFNWISITNFRNITNMKQTLFSNLLEGGKTNQSTQVSSHEFNINICTISLRQC